MGWLPRGEACCISHRLRRRLTLGNAVKVRLVSERSLGTFLSGGIDFPIVAALTARHHAGRIKTFSIGFDDPALDGPATCVELTTTWARTTPISSLPPTPSKYSRLTKAYDLPFADSSAIPSLLLSELASREAIVALSGDGGDKGFGGCLRYRAAETLQCMNPVWSATSGLADPAAALRESAGQRMAVRPTRHRGSMPNVGVRYRGLMEHQPSEIRELVRTPET